MKGPVDSSADPRRVALYRHFDRNGCLLYVGISGSHLLRLAAHMESSVWAGEIAQITVQWFEDREGAAAAEALAIQRERPLHNRAIALNHKPEPVRNLVAIWGSMTDMARGIGEGETTVRNWFGRGSIPAKYDARIMEAARKAGGQVTPDDLHRIRQALFQESIHKSFRRPATVKDPTKSAAA